MLVTQIKYHSFFNITESNLITTPSTELKKENPWGNQKANQKSYTGDMSDLRIEHDGKIVRWEFFSALEGGGAFQVWRPTGNTNV